MGPQPPNMFIAADYTTGDILEEKKKPTHKTDNKQLIF